ncbi:hypothetical protein AB5I41_06980 [Sphingomonas sp. MMS24-JH45]
MGGRARAARGGSGAGCAGDGAQRGLRAARAATGIEARGGEARRGAAMARGHVRRRRDAVRGLGRRQLHGPAGRGHDAGADHRCLQAGEVGHRLPSDRPVADRRRLEEGRGRHRPRCRRAGRGRHQGKHIFCREPT